MISKLKFIFLILYLNTAFSQSFIPLDEETLEFIEDVDYHLYSNNIRIFSGLCDNDKITNLPSISFDSISFNKINYKQLGFKRDNITNTILLSKNLIEIDEVVIISSKKEDIILGEKNRFINRMSNSISKEILYGITFQNSLNFNLNIDKLVYFVDKIKFKTAYRINIFDYNQVPINLGHQYAEIGKLLYSTDTLYLEPKQKGKVEIKIKENETISKGNSVFITLELIAYYDIDNNIIQPSLEDFSKIKFQLSNKTNYYAKRIDLTNGKLTENLININAMINYDFANKFFSKPHKSSIVTPAILLYTKKSD